jgi:hypothetical protein
LVNLSLGFQAHVTFSMIFHTDCGEIWCKFAISTRGINASMVYVEARQSILQVDYVELKMETK